jgi:formamidopyrimidine-DNA glycosylase
MTIEPAGKGLTDNGAEHKKEKTNPAHDHVIFHMLGGTIIRYNDPRRFGLMTIIEKGGLESHKLFANLGPEPLSDDFCPLCLAEKAKGRKNAIKNFLLDQRVVAGLGNIYVCEALFRAGIDPRRAAALLATKAGKPSAAARRLVPHIKEILREAIKSGGSTLRDYRHADGSLGYFQHSFAVYGREGERCNGRKRHARASTGDDDTSSSLSTCTARILRINQSGRSTFYCPRCQK